MDSIQKIQQEYANKLVMLNKDYITNMSVYYSDAVVKTVAAGGSLEHIAQLTNIANAVSKQVENDLKRMNNIK